MRKSDALRLGLVGDLMLGRGIDQALETSCDPRLYERFVSDARDYVTLAERANGGFPRPISCGHLWGDALRALAPSPPDLLLGNLETAVTTHPEPYPGKAIHYRMHPANLGCLSELGLDGVTLANNHVLDWGQDGLVETLWSLADAGIPYGGAGRTAAEAAEPLRLDANGLSVAVFAHGAPDSGVPEDWAATEQAPGVQLLPDFEEATVDRLVHDVQERTSADDVVVVSMHWGSNWGWEVPRGHRRLAHRLIEEADVDVIHGHSSHHPRPFEIYREKLILYGCGDFLNDYEGIGHHKRYRGDLAVLYLPELAVETGALRRLALNVFQIRRFGLRAASAADAEWVAEALAQHGPASAPELAHMGDHRLALEMT